MIKLVINMVNLDTYKLYALDFPGLLNKFFQLRFKILPELRNMIILEHYSFAQTIAVIISFAAPDRILFKLSPAGNCFSRIVYFRLRTAGSVNIFISHRCYTAKPLEKIK